MSTEQLVFNSKTGVALNALTFKIGLTKEKNNDRNASLEIIIDNLSNNELADILEKVIKSNEG